MSSRSSFVRGLNSGSNRSHRRSRKKSLYLDDEPDYSGLYGAMTQAMGALSVLDELHTLVLRVSLDDTIRMMRSAIALETGIAPSDQRLFRGEQEIEENSQRLSQLHLGDRDVIEVRPRIDRKHHQQQHEAWKIQLKQDADAYQPYHSAQIQVIAWEESDIEGTSGDVAAVYKCFQARGYEIETLLLPLSGPSRVLKKGLRRFVEHAESNALLMIFYTGHGGATSGRNNLMFGPFLRSPQSMRISWNDIKGPILNSKNDIVLVLDCCQAGQAQEFHTIPVETTEVKGIKHIIGACSWESEATTGLIRALCAVFSHWPLSTPLTTADWASQAKSVLLQGNGMEFKRERETMIGKNNFYAQPFFDQLYPGSSSRQRAIVMPTMPEGGRALGFSTGRRIGYQ